MFTIKAYFRILRKPSDKTVSSTDKREDLPRDEFYLWRRCASSTRLYAMCEAILCSSPHKVRGSIAGWLSFDRNALKRYCTARATRGFHGSFCPKSVRFRLSSSLIPSARDRMRAHHHVDTILNYRKLPKYRRCVNESRSFLRRLTPRCKSGQTDIIF